MIAPYMHSMCPDYIVMIVIELLFCKKVSKNIVTQNMIFLSVQCVNVLTNCTVLHANS